MIHRQTQKDKAFYYLLMYTYYETNKAHSLYKDTNVKWFQSVSKIKFFINPADSRSQARKNGERWRRSDVFQVGDCIATCVAVERVRAIYGSRLCLVKYTVPPALTVTDVLNARIQVSARACLTRRHEDAFDPIGCLHACLGSSWVVIDVAERGKS